MTDPLAALVAEMEAAAAALDYERARSLRDRIALIRGGGDDMGDDAAGIERQRPGRMGLGTGQPSVAPPDGWVKPVKPDPMTRNRNRRR